VCAPVSAYPCRVLDTIGVDVGGTKILAGRVRPDGSVVARRRAATRQTSGVEMLDQVAQIVGDLVGGDEVLGIGVGLPGTIDQRRGLVVQAANLPLADLPAHAHLERATGLHVVIDNDGNCAAVAEHQLGAAAGRHHSVTLTLGTGVGGGVVIDDRPFRGSSGAGAELGHIVIDRDGPPCPGSCPGHGHLESYCSGTAFGLTIADHVRAHPDGTLARAAGDGKADGRLALERAAAGDEEALGLLHAVGDALGHGLVSLAHAFEPEVFVIGGGFGQATREWVLAPAREVLQAEAMHPMANTPVVGAQLGGEAGMLGAAALPRLR
jgi:glucokinase